MCAGSVRQSDAPAKLKAFCPKEVLTGGRFSWQVEEDRVSRIGLIILTMKLYVILAVVKRT